MRRAVWILTALVLMGQAPLAEDPRLLWPDGQPPQVEHPPRRPYKQEVENKFVTGLIYAGLAPVHVLEGPLEGTLDGPPVVGTVGGIGMGLMCGAVMGLSGAINMATCWWPYWSIDARKHYPSCVLGIDAGDFSTIFGR
jgi:hypothetical protein